MHEQYHIYNLIELANIDYPFPKETSAQSTKPYREESKQASVPPTWLRWSNKKSQQKWAVVLHNQSWY